MTFLSHRGLAKRWGISTKKLMDLSRTGRAVPYIQTGTGRYYLLADVMAFERQRRHQWRKGLQ